MCGLAGIFRPVWTERERSAIIDLTLISQVRGIDSTGVIKLSSSKKNVFYSVDKSADSANEFLYDRRRTFFNPPEPKTDMYGMLVHVRAATKGNITDKNAHPFEFNRIVGMHNGTIHGSFKHSPMYNTDSEAIYRNLNDADSIEEGLKEVNKAYSKVAYALQFYDKSSGSIHFIRNKERPLFMAWEAATDTYVTASEKLFIKYLERRHGFQFKRIIQLKENKLYTIQLNRSSHFTFSEKQLKVEKPPVTYHSNYTPPGKNHNYGSQWKPPGTPNNSDSGFVLFSSLKWPSNEFLAKMEAARFKKQTDDSVPFLDKNPKQTNLLQQNQQKTTGQDSQKHGGLEASRAPYLSAPKHIWEGLVADGCMYCQDVPYYNQRKQLVWIDDYSYLCPHCSKDKAASAFLPLGRLRH